MGKGIFIAATASLLLFAGLSQSGRMALFQSSKEQSEYQELAIARNLAESALESAVSAARRDLMDLDHQYFSIPMDGGTYDVAVNDAAYGDLSFGVTSRSGATRYGIDAHAIFEAPLEAALMLSATEVEAHGAGSYEISGHDHRAPSKSSSRGFLRPAVAINANTPGNVSAVSAGLDGNRVVGDGGSSSIAEGVPTATLEQLYAEALALPSTTTITAPFTGTFGTVDNPSVIRVVGPFQNSGPFSGAGLLVVDDGHFVVDGDFSWEGVVLIRKDVTDSVHVGFSAGADLYGSAIAYDATSGPSSSSCDDVPFVIDGLDTVPEIPYNMTAEVLGAAISYGGSYDMPVTTKLVIGSADQQPWGPWSQAVTGNVNDGSTHLFEPTESFPAGTPITVSARSWVRRYRRRGNRNSDWRIFMEQDSQMGGGQLVVLRNGDPVPDVQGYLGQSSVADFVQNYIGSDGTIVLDDNQSIYLFELGSTNPNSAAFDLQDLVVLVTMTNASGGCASASSADKIYFTIDGGSQIRYSGEAIAKLGKYLDAVRQRTRVVLTRQQATTLRSEEQSPGTG